LSGKEKGKNQLKKLLAASPPLPVLEEAAREEFPSLRGKKRGKFYRTLSRFLPTRMGEEKRGESPVHDPSKGRGGREERLSF